MDWTQPLTIGENVCKCKTCNTEYVALIEQEDLDDGCTRTSMMCYPCFSMHPRIRALTPTIVKEALRK